MRPPRESAFADAWWDQAMPPGTSSASKPLLKHERAADIARRTGQASRSKLGITWTRDGFGGPGTFHRPPAGPSQEPEAERQRGTLIPGIADSFEAVRLPGETERQRLARELVAAQFLERRERLRARRTGVTA